MVRPKLQLERLNGDLSKEHYFLHNKSIVNKKVQELSVLTAADVLFFAFSPSGVPTLLLGEYSNFINILRRFSEVPINDREKRRLDNLRTLRTNYQKKEYNVDVHNLFHAWKVKRIQDMQEELATLNNEISNLNQIKRNWEDQQDVDSLEKINEMEASLLKSLEEVRNRKNEIISEQEMMANPDPTPLLSSLEFFEDYLTDVLSGNDDNLLAYANLLSDGNQADSSENKSQ